MIRFIKGKIWKYDMLLCFELFIMLISWVMTFRNRKTKLNESVIRNIGPKVKSSQIWFWNEIFLVWMMPWMMHLLALKLEAGETKSKIVRNGHQAGVGLCWSHKLYHIKVISIHRLFFFLKCMMALRFWKQGESSKILFILYFDLSIPHLLWTNTIYQKLKLQTLMPYLRVNYKIKQFQRKHPNKSNLLLCKEREREMHIKREKHLL